MTETACLCAPDFSDQDQDPASLLAYLRTKSSSHHMRLKCNIFECVQWSMFLKTFISQKDLDIMLLILKCSLHLKANHRLFK